MKNKGILTLAMMMIMATASAQIEVNGQNLRSVLNDKMAGDYNNGGEKKLYNDDFSKNPFIFKGWQYSRIEFKDGKVADSLLLNYDDKSDALLVTMVEGTNPFTIRTKEVARFTFYTDPAKPFFGKKSSEFDDSDKPYGFYQRIYGNDDGSGAIVLKQQVKKFRSADDQVSYGGSQAESKFDLYTRYYVKNGEGKFKKVSLGKKTIQGLIGKANVKKAQSLIKAKKLKWGDEEALFLVLDNFK